MNKKIFPISILSAFILCLLLTTFHQFIFGDRIFVFSDVRADTFEQFYPMSLVLRDYLNDTRGFYDYSLILGLGQPLEIMADQLFVLFEILFQSDRGIAHALVYSLSIKIFLAGLFFYLYLGLFHAPPWIRIFLSLSYAFSAYIQVNSQWRGHAAEPFLLAILLFSLELSLRGKKLGYFFIPMTVVLALYSHWFHLYTLGLFAVLYLGFRLKQTGKWKSLLPIAFFSIIGLFISLPHLLPSLHYMSLSPRVTGDSSRLVNESFFSFLKPDEIYYIFKSLVSVFHKNNSGILENHLFWNYLESPSLSTNLIVLVFAIIFFLSEKISRSSKFFLSIFLLVFFLFPAVKTVWYGFGYLNINRISNLFFIFITLVVALKAYRVFQTYSGERKKNLWLLSNLSIFFLLFLIFGIGKYYGEKLENLEIHLLLLTFSFLGIFLIQFKNKFRFYILALAVLEIFIMHRQSVQGGIYYSFDSLMENYSESRQSIEYIKNHTDYDKKLYRIELDYSIIKGNTSSWYLNYRGVKNYSFIDRYTMGISDFFNMFNTTKINNKFFNPIGDGRLQGYFSVKYLLSRKDRTGSCFRELNRFGSVRIFENSCVLDFVRLYDSVKNIDEMSEVTTYQRINQARSMALLPGSKLTGNRILENKNSAHLETTLNSNVDGQSPHSVHYHFLDRKLHIYLKTNKSGVLMLPIPFNEGWQLHRGEEELDTFAVSNGFLGSFVPAGENMLVLSYNPPGKNIGYAFAFLSFLAFFPGFWFFRKYNSWISS